MKEIRRYVNKIVNSEFQCRDIDDPTQRHIRNTLLFEYWHEIQDLICGPIRIDTHRKVNDNEE